MTLAVILIAKPDAAPLDSRLVGHLENILGTRAHWLAPEEACELIVDAHDGDVLRAQVDEVMGEWPVDRVILPAAGREKRLLISDMDSTMITVECIDELAAYVERRDEVTAITRRAMNGELDFAEALNQRVALFAGLPVSVLEDVYRERVQLMPGATTLVRTMRARGARTVLVSGGFFPIVGWVRDALGFDHADANRLAVEDGCLTGSLEGPLRDGQSKLSTLDAELRALGLAVADAVAVGDGANDLPMIRRAGLGVAYRAHPNVEKAAPVAIRHADLTALLYLQGLHRSEFADG